MLFSIKKSDIILIVFLLLTGLSLFSFNALNNEKGSVVKITLNGNLYGNYSLNKNQDITIENNGHKNIVTIKDKKISMYYSDCDGQECVKSGKTGRAGVPIICSPNGIVVIITGSETDTVAY